MAAEAHGTGPNVLDSTTGPTSCIDPRGLILAVIVFIGGISSIAVETGASRLIGPYFGESTFIWANLIGLTLLYLTIGYFIGGRLADRWPNPRLLFTITAVAGISIAITPYLARPILRTSMDAFDATNVNAFIGSLVGTLFLCSRHIVGNGFAVCSPAASGAD